jgi:glycosyltransferase involved in cell wall biosynthesis
MKKIAIIIQKLSGGGAERNASNLSIFLSKYHEVHLIVFDCTNITYPHAGTLHDLKIPPSKGVFGKIKNVFARVSAVKKIKKQYGIETTISLMDGANLVNCFTRTGDKIITSVRIQMSKSRKSKGIMGFAEKLVQRTIAKRSDLVVGVSLGVSEDMVKTFGLPQEKVTTIYNSCDGEMLREKALIHAEEASGMAKNSVITMGRMTDQKGQWHLIRAFRKITAEIPDAKLYLLGDGPFREKLEELTKELGLCDSVVFLGYKEAPHAYIANSTMLALPSLFEGLSNVLIESLACGVPCVASDCYSGSREILSGKNDIKEVIDEYELCEYGIITSVCGKGEFDAVTPLTKTEHQLADAIIRMFRDDTLREEYKRKAKDRAAEFSPENITARWNEVI